MKKLSVLFLLCLLLGGCNLFSKPVEARTKITTSTSADGRINTSKTWYWSPTVNGDQMLNYVDYNVNSVKTVPLLVGYSGYIEVTVPKEILYIYEYGLSVKAEDSSYLIDIRRDISIDSLIEDYNLSGYKFITDNVVESQGNGARTIIAVVDDYYGVIATVYNDDLVYSIIRDGMLNLNVTAIEEVYEPTNEVEYLKELPQSSVYSPTVEIDSINITRDMHLFADGSLVIQSELRHFDEIYDKYATVLSVFAGEEVSHIYRANMFTFMKAGKYTLGLFAYNSNTTIVLIGDCPEAEANIVSIILSLL